MTYYFKGTDIINHAKNYFYNEYSVDIQIENFKNMTLIQLIAIKRENEKLAVLMKEFHNRYQTPEQDEKAIDFYNMMINLYITDKDAYEQDRNNNFENFEKENEIMEMNKKLLQNYFFAVNRYKTDPKYVSYAKYNDALSLAIKNLSVEGKDKTKYNKKIYDNTEVLCECGAHSYRKVLARHRRSDLHAKRMEKLNK